MKLPIAEERWLSKYCTLELHNGLAVKTFNKNFPKHVNEEWLKYYNHFRSLWNYTPVKIFEITENQSTIISSKVSMPEFLFKLNSKVWF